MQAYLKHIVQTISVPGFRNVQGSTWPLMMDYLENEIRGLGHSVDVQSWHDNTGILCKNFIVRLEGKRKETFILGGHYDSFDDTPGADDNASAVAVILGVLRELNPRETLEYSWEFIFYACEEPPYFGTKSMGSYVHASQVDSRQIKCMICLEMVGMFINASGSQSYPFSPLRWIYGDKGNFLLGVSLWKSGRIPREIMRKLRHRNPRFYRKLFLPFSISGLDWSDHRNYWLHNIPALMLTDTAMFRNTHYHTLGDVPESLNYEAMETIVGDLISIIKTE